MKLYNTLSRKIEEFKPLHPPKVGLYSCGPTVYDYSHIGHMRRYVGDDILRRVLDYNGFQVKQVMNITDVGHLTSDADEGEDKMEKGAKKLGQSVWEMAKFFEQQFFESTDALNIQRPHIICRATEHIQEQIDLVKKLEQKGFTYQTDQGVYFDISKFADYTKLSRQKLEDLKVAVRTEVATDPQKKHPADFALWLFTVGRFKNHTMHWQSPWGEGFPGWHIECSAMSMKYLGDTLDIHTGGVDHISVHHTNEIAQSEAVTDKPFARFWVHHEFLQVDGQKMSKSLGNLYTVEDIKQKGFNPLALRYLFLTAHYRKPLNFTWKALGATAITYKKLKETMDRLKQKENMEDYEMFSKHHKGLPHSTQAQVWVKRFKAALEDDLNIPEAIAIVWQIVKNKDIPSGEKAVLLEEWDQVLGLRLAEVSKVREVPKAIEELRDQRAKLRQEKKWQEADKIRQEIEKQGYKLEDTTKGTAIKKK